MIELDKLRGALAELGFPTRHREALIRGAFRNIGVPLRRATEDDLRLAMQGPLAEAIKSQIPGFFPAGRYQSLLDELAPVIPEGAAEERIPVNLRTPEGRADLVRRLEGLRGLSGVYFLLAQGEVDTFGTPLPDETLRLIRHTAESAAQVGGTGVLLVHEDHTYAARKLRDGVVIVALHPWAGHGVLLDLIGRIEDEEEV